MDFWSIWIYTTIFNIVAVSFIAGANKDESDADSFLSAIMFSLTGPVMTIIAVSMMAGKYFRKYCLK